MEKERKSKFVFILLSFAFAILFLSLGIVYALPLNAPQIGSSYSGSGYAAPIDFFNNNVAIFDISPNSFSSTQVSLNLAVDYAANLVEAYIWKTGYFWSPVYGEWIPFEFSEPTVGGSNWIDHSASRVLNGPSLIINASKYLRNGYNYVVTYSCRKVSGVWKCGCENAADSSCNKWMLQVFSFNDVFNSSSPITQPTSAQGGNLWCATNLDCASSSGKQCIRGVCSLVRCNNNLDCVGKPLPLCNNITGNCVECLSDSICNVSAGQSCVNNSCAVSALPFWSQSFSGYSGTLYSRVIRVDSFGNVYALANMSLTIKYDSAGNKLWVKDLKTNGLGEGSRIALDSSGNIYSIGGESINKFDKDGNKIWNKSIFTSNLNLGWPSITLDSSGNIYSVGVSSYSNLITIKYNSSGNLLWNQTYAVIGGLSTAISVDSLGKVYANVQTGGLRNLYTVSYASNGAQLWARTIVNGSQPFVHLQPMGNAVDSFGNLYIAAGLAEGSVVTFVLFKYDSNGNLLWANRMAGGKAKSVALDSLGNAYVTGSIIPVSSALLIAKVAPNGTLIWSKNLTDINSKYGFNLTAALYGGEGITLDSSDNIYWVGGGQIFKIPAQ